MFRVDAIGPPDVPGTDVQIRSLMGKVKMYDHSAYPDGAVVRLAQEKCSGPPYPAGRVLGIVDLHCPSTAPAGGHLFVLHLTAINTVLPSAAVAAHTLDRNHLFDSAGENAGFFGIGDPQENIIMAAGCFISGSSIELSADGPLREPYTVYFQGGLTYYHSKFGVMMSLQQLLEDGLIKKEQPYNLIFLASCEEEVSGKNGIEKVLPQLPPIDVALVGEPTGMQPAIAEKGLMVLDVTVHGRSGHAARNEGDNAIYKAIKDISWFQNFEFPEKSQLLGPVKMTVTIINSGTQHNVIPDQCVFTVDIRSNEKYTNEEIYDFVSKHIAGNAQARSFRLNSSCIPETHPLVQRIVQQGRTPFGSPTLSDQALMRFPSLKMGPGDSARSHTANEYIKIGEIKEAIGLYIEILDQIKIQNN